MRERTDLAIVIPVYNSETSLKELTMRLVSTLKAMHKSFSIIFINDNSKDNSLSVLKQIKQEYGEAIIIVSLTRNYGQQNALMCGFQFCKADYIVTLDDDLQNPPEELPILLNRIEQGADAVFAKYEVKHDRVHKNWGSLLIRNLNYKIFGIENKIVFSSYRIIRAFIIEEIRNNRTKYPYISGMIMSITNKVENVLVKHEQRKHGKSNYSLGKLIQLSFNLLINYSSIPLKIICYLGLFFSLFSMLFGLFFVARKVVIGQVPAGWTTLVVLISMNNAILMLLLFFFGEYLSRILREISHHSPYSIAEVIE